MNETQAPEQERDPQPWIRLAELAAAGDVAALEGFVDTIGPSEAFRALSRLEPQQREQVLTTLSPAEAADLIEEIPDEHAADLLEQIPAADAVSILSEMESSERADVVADLEEANAEAIFAEMAPEQAEEVRRLAAYPSESAGGLMRTEHLAFGENVTVGEVTAALEAAAESVPAEEVNLYVVTPRARLIGAVDLRRLVLSRRSVTLADLLAPPAFVLAGTPLDELITFFDRHECLSAPVVDERQRLLGVLYRSAIDEALAERSERERQKTQGIVGGDEIRTLPTTVRARRRLSWLSLNIVLNIISASVIALFEDTLSAVIALAVFLPIVSDMSGCSGNQAVAVSLRELSLGLVRPYEVLRVWLQEISVGLMNGAVLGVLLGLAAWAWKGNPYLGLVVGVALAANTLVAVSIGGTVPLLLKRFGIDPAVASGPILTTVTDMFGFFLVLGIATLMLTQLSM